jgi:AcrR family transcriptional regulator
MPRKSPTDAVAPDSDKPAATRGAEKLSSADKANAILDAAASVFMEIGFAAASVDDISEAYGATKGIIYYHFRNKSALFFAVQRRAMEMTREAIEPPALADQSAATRLYDMAYAHTMLMMSQLSYLRVAAQGLELHLTGRTSARERTELEAIMALRDSNETLYVKVIEAGVKQGEFRPLDPKLSVKPLLGALNWTSRWYRPRPKETDKDRVRIATEVASFAVQALLA